jgi:hypothetical protein
MHVWRNTVLLAFVLLYIINKLFIHKTIAEASMIMVQLKDDQKIQALLMRLQQRYSAAHKMRE